jgi:hypothetical protein
MKSFSFFDFLICSLARYRELKKNKEGLKEGQQCDGKELKKEASPDS